MMGDSGELVLGHKMVSYVQTLIASEMGNFLPT